MKKIVRNGVKYRLIWSTPNAVQFDFVQSVHFVRIESFIPNDYQNYVIDFTNVAIWLT